MGLGKTYSTQYLADSNNNTGAAGQVLISTSTGVNWSDGTDIIGGPYLPLAGGTLTGGLIGTSANFVGTIRSTLASDNSYYSLFSNNGSLVLDTAGVNSGMQFKILGSTKLTMTNAGNVGIGVTDTGAKLQIDKANANSSVIISRSGTNLGVSTGIGSITFPAHYNSSYTNYAAIQAYSNNLSSLRGSLDFKVKSTSGTLLTGMTLYGTSAGINVGIGTTSPSTKLELYGYNSSRNTLENLLTLNGGANSNNPYSGFGMGIKFSGRDYSNAVRDYAYIYGVMEDANSHSTPAGDPGFESQLRFYTNTGGASATLPTQKMVITGPGNVGIGVTGPVSKLEVFSTATNTATFKNSIGQQTVTFGSTTNTAYSDIVLATNSGTGEIFKAGTGYTSWGGALALNIYNSNGAIAFHPSSTANSMFIATSGNVGIGTTSPSYPFSLESATTGLISRIYNTNDDGQGLLIRAGATTSATRVFQLASSNDTKILTVNSNGNVGIGTTSPSEKLEVNGVIESPYLEYKPFVFYDFNSDTVSQWGVGNATLSTPSKSVTRFTTTGTDSNLNRNFDGSGYNSPAIPGGQNQIIRIRYKWISGTAGSGEIFYATSGHPYSGSYYKSYDLNTDGEYHTLVLDMSNLSSGGTDWIDNDITAIRFDLINITPVVIDIDWIAVGGNGWGTQYFENDVAFMNGNVGIGTTTPGAKLEVNGQIVINSTALGNQDAFSIYNSTNQLFHIQNSSSNDEASLLLGANNVIKVKLDTAGDSYLNGGNVGIGTTSPEFKLDVDGEIQIRRLHKMIFDTSASSGNPTLYVDSNADWNIDNTAGSNIVHIENGGNVGIGTTSPRDKLDVVGTAYINNLRVGFTGSPSPPVSFFGTRGTFYNNAFQTNYMMHCASSATNLGFTRGPSDSSPLTFNAGDRTGATNAIGSITLTSAGTSYNTTSDYRLKENEEKISNAIDRLKNLKPIRFNWILEPEEEKVDGFLAHEVAEVVPEAVTGEKDAIDYKGDDDLQMLENSKLVPLLTAALQQAIDKIELLEQRIQSIENK
jgi:hypothetical protein